MKKVLTVEDATMTAYAIGMVASKGTLMVEGIGSRITNWGVGVTLTLKGITAPAAKDAMAFLADLTNHDARNIRGSGVVVHLTTINESRLFGDHLGIREEVENAIEEIRMLDETSGRNEQFNRVRRENYGKPVGISSDGASVKTIPMSTLEDKLLDVAIRLTHGLISDDMILHAFIEGNNGLALGADDVTALMAGNGILDRYGMAA